jgi:hypothetical protein
MASAEILATVGLRPMIAVPSVRGLPASDSPQLHQHA